MKRLQSLSSREVIPPCCSMPLRRCQGPPDDRPHVVPTGGGLLLLPLVQGSLLEDAGPQAEPVQRHLDGWQRTLAQQLPLVVVMVQQHPAAHHAQERHCGQRGDTHTLTSGVLVIMTS